MKATLYHSSGNVEVDVPDSQLIKSQKMNYTRMIDFEDGKRAKLEIEIRWDDQCGNGHNTFAMTGTISRNGRELMCGCLHSEIHQYYPELAHLIPWHLMGSNGPMHYLANTLYFAGNRDYNGHVKGEPCSWQDHLKFPSWPITFPGLQKRFMGWLITQQAENLKIVDVEHEDDGRYLTKFSPRFTFSGAPGEKWSECPFDNRGEAERFIEACRIEMPEIVRVSTDEAEGKEPEIEAARAAAFWPDATPEQLNDKQALIDRLPALMREFKKVIESLGFTY